MLRDEVIACEQAGVLATNDMVWGGCGSYLRCAIRDVDYRVEWAPRVLHVIVWLVLGAVVPSPFNRLAALFVYASVIGLLVHRRVVVLVGNTWYPLAEGLRRREARDLVRTLRVLWKGCRVLR